MSGYKLIYTNIIRDIKVVRLYDETIRHIMDQHPEIPLELPSIVAAIESAIAKPTHIEMSHSNSFVFVDQTSTNRSGDPLRIPVKKVDGASGRVKTAYFASPGATVNIIWRKD